MTPRTGRPKAEKPLDASIKVRLDKDLRLGLDDYAKDNGLTPTEVFIS